ncbi:3-oxoacyl-ACP synthase III family protein [Actinomadura chibensis]|uniref:Ketoacyl-ACP synthase III n=2 Tax=Actinomadura chibensis TaxID=392828 RepID=A0A5D0NAY6_9ACTN|nr:ketoacyl-ACP synthase III [Actinomadura chibensis]TYB41345.1 ketoacyl-ACP synthase III [Actinomadura chibensis]
MTGQVGGRAERRSGGTDRLPRPRPDQRLPLGGPSWAIRATGSYLPGDGVPSTEVSASLGLDPGWIESRTGIRRRHVAAPAEAASDLAAAAADRALRAAGIDAADVGLIVLGTSTPDVLAPSTACRVQAMLGARRAAAFDISAACTGFVFGLQSAVGWLATQRGAAPYALVVGVEVYSRFLNRADRATAALFGDGAAAAVVGPVPPPYGFGPITLGSDGSGADDVLIPAGGSRTPASAATLAGHGHTIHMDGRAVRDFIARIFPRLVGDAADAAGLKPADLDLVVPHQPNPRLVASLAGDAGLDPGQLAIVGQDVGNIGAASIPYALDRAARDDRIGPGDLVLLAGFGAGLTWGHTLITWPPP